ncbi:TetR/AcrR family transcriptional regulator [Ferruginibacter yonginensis]|uniref:TetR/AcrR family transcriptional regulator n=1 Tax=Ferruginibacter yonginensis TaxID=1310416 RepID=A0ABV8QN48_9BACT
METKDKKQHILETAEELFAIKGYEASTVRDIADAAQVNLAMISYYFGSKEKLMLQLFHDRMKATKLRVESLVKNPDYAPFQKVEIMLDEYIKKVFNNQAFYRILLCEQVMKKNKEVIDLMKELKLSYALLFSDLIKEGQRKKVFKKNIDVVMALTIMTGTVTQLMINKEHYANFNALECANEADIDTLLHQKVYNQLKEIFKTILGYES